jgi:hypothetical protein
MDELISVRAMSEGDESDADGEGAGDSAGVAAPALA